MPAIWASSERPLFVRTVWVDGMRHAILSPDDPVVNSRLRRRPQISKETIFPTKHQQETRLDCLNSCFMNLHVMVEKNFPDNKNSARFTRRQSAPPCTRMCTAKPEHILEIYANDMNKRLDKRYENCQTSRKEEISLSVDAPVFNCNTNVGQTSERSYSQRNMFSTISECKQTDETSDVHCNPLSERVLQWLDLSGKAQDYELEIESEGSLKLEDDRQKRRYLLSKRQDSSSFTEKEHVIVQNYKLQKNCKLEHITRSETKSVQMGLPKLKDTTNDEMRKEENIEYILPEISKDQVSVNTEMGSSKDDAKSRDDSLTAWSPPGRLQLHIVMPSFNSIEKRTSSLESLICD